MSAYSQIESFDSPQSVIDYFRRQIVDNGTPDLAGLEEEIILVDRNGKAVDHDRFQQCLGELIRALPQGKIIEGRSVDGDIIPVLKGDFDSGSVQPETNTTLIEFAHKPAASAWDSFEQSRHFAAQLMKTAAAHQLTVIGGGAVPTMSWDECRGAVIRNGDFAYSVQHMTEGSRPEYCRTVFGTASIHHNMGFDDPEAMARYIVAALRMQPTMIALLGNAPFWDGRRAHKDGAPLLSYRSRVQIDYGHIFGAGDGVSYLYPDFMIDPRADFAAIVQGYLDMPLDRTIVDGRKRSCPGLTMREYLRGHEIDGRIRRPNADALTMMVREPIVDVRPCFTGSAPRVETRAHDGVSQQCAVAVDAFYRGIRANLDQAHALMAGMTNSEIRRARHAVCEQGLAASVCHVRPEIETQQDLARRLLSISEEGLDARGHGEAQLLAPLQVIAETGLNPAQRLIAACGEQGARPRDLLRAMAYTQQGFADGALYAWPSHAPRARLYGPGRAACDLSF